MIGKSRIINNIGNVLLTTGVKWEKEYKFHPVRKWRFDYACPELKIAIEYEGLFSAKSRHTTVTGFTGDCEKYNAAQIEGWIVLRFTAKSTSLLTPITKAVDLRKNMKY